MFIRQTPPPNVKKRRRRSGTNFFTLKYLVYVTRTGTRDRRQSSFSHAHSFCSSSICAVPRRRSSILSLSSCVVQVIPVPTAVCAHTSVFLFHFWMPFCSWCVSDKATRSDDEDAGKQAAGPSKAASLTKVTSTTRSIQHTQHEVKIPDVPQPIRPEQIFDRYADEDDANVMGPEGLQKLCADANIPIEGSLPLLLVWQLDAKDMSAITREEWMTGMKDIGCVSTDA